MSDFCFNAKLTWRAGIPTNATQHKTIKLKNEKSIHLASSTVVQIVGWIWYKFKISHERSVFIFLLSIGSFGMVILFNTLYRETIKPQQLFWHIAIVFGSYHNANTTNKVKRILNERKSYSLSSTMTKQENQNDSEDIRRLVRCEQKECMSIGIKSEHLCSHSWWIVIKIFSMIKKSYIPTVCRKVNYLLYLPWEKYLVRANTQVHGRVRRVFFIRLK